MRPTLEVNMSGKQLAVLMADIRCRVSHPMEAHLIVAPIEERIDLPLNGNIEILCGGYQFHVKAMNPPRNIAHGKMAFKAIDRLAIDRLANLVGLSSTGSLKAADVMAIVGERKVSLTDTKELETKCFLASVDTSLDLLDGLASNLQAVWFRKNGCIHLTSGLPSTVTHADLTLFYDSLDGYYLEPTSQDFPYLGDTILIDNRPEIVSEISIRACGGHPEIRLKTRQKLIPVKSKTSTDWVPAKIVDEKNVVVEIQVANADPIQIIGSCLQRELALFSENVPISKQDSVRAKVPTQGVLFGPLELLLVDASPPGDVYRLHVDQYEATYEVKKERVDKTASLITGGVCSIKSSDAIEFKTATIVDIRRE